MATDSICKISSPLNSGSLSVTYYSNDKKTVIKVPKKGNSDEVGFLPGYFGDISYSEVDSTCRIISPFLIRCLSIFARGECAKDFDVSFRLELCVGTIKDLVDVNIRPSRLEYNKFKTLFLTSCLGIRHLHRNNCLHLDISEGNILYVNEGDMYVSKVIDPGISNYIQRDEDMKLLPLKSTKLRVTTVTRPPEVFKESTGGGVVSYTDKVDVWSLGILFLTYVQGSNPSNFFTWNKYWQSLTKKEKTKGVYMMDMHVLGLIHANFGDAMKFDMVMDNIISLKCIPADEEEDFKSLLKGMLNIDPTKRLSIEDVIDHRYFTRDPLHQTDILTRPVNFKRKVQHEYGDTYKIVVPHTILRDVAYSENLFEGIRYIFEVSVNAMSFKILKHGAISARCFTLALDIYMRISLGCGPNTEKHESMALGLLALRFAYGIFQGVNIDGHFDEIVGKYDKAYQHLGGKGHVISKMVEYEGHCLKLIQGVINHSYYFDLCTSLEEVAIVIDTIFMSEKKFDILRCYMSIDFLRMIQQIRSQYRTDEITDPTPLTGSADSLLLKVRSIKEFLSLQSKTPASPQREKRLSDITKVTSFITLLKHLKAMIKGHPEYRILTILDLFFYYISKVSSEDKSTLEILPFVCIYFVYCTDVNTTKDVPQKYLQNQIFSALWVKIYNSDTWKICSSHRIHGIFEGSGLNIAKFFYYCIYGKAEGSSYNTHHFSCLEGYDSWDLV